MKRLLATVLGTALALDPDVAGAATPTHKSLQALSAQTLGEVTLVVNNSMIADQCSPKWEESARAHNYDVYRDAATARCYAWDETYKLAELNPAVGAILRPEGDTDTDACISSQTYIDEFTKEGQRFLVIDDQDVTANMVCPPLEETQPVSVSPTQLATIAEVPTVGNFGQVDPQIIKEAVFLNPVNLGLEEDQVDKKMDNPKNLLRRGRLGVDVYAKYEKVKYDSSSGRLTVRLDNDKKVDKCTVAITYTNSFVQDGVRYFVVTSDFETNPEECLETTPPRVELADALSRPLSTGVSAGKPWHVKGYGLIGYNEEEAGSPYSLGGAGYGSLAVQVRSPFAPICVGVNGSAIIADEGAGFESLTGTVGYCDDRFDVALQAGTSWEPRAPETALNKAPTLGIVGHVDVLELGSWAINVGGSARADLYGGGVFPANLTAFVGATHDFEIGGTKKKLKGSAPQEPQSPQPVDVPESVGNGIVTITESSSEAMAETARVTHAPTALETAEYVRLRAELGRLKTLVQIRTNFQKLEALMIPIADAEYTFVLTELEKAGDMNEYYRIARLFAQSNPGMAQSYLETIKNNYGLVTFEVTDELSSQYKLEAVPVPFDPMFLHAIEFSNTLLRVNGSHNVMLPAGDYLVAGQRFTLKAGAALHILIDDPSREKPVSPVSLKKEPYGYSFLLNEVSDTTDDAKIESDRQYISAHLFEEVKARNWTAAAVQFTQLEETILPLTKEEYFNGALAAFYMGNVEEAYQRLQKAAASSGMEKTETSVATWMGKIEANYASVTITTADFKGTPTLEHKGNFADKIEEAAFKQAVEELKQSKGYTGLLPISVTYKLSGETLEVEPLSSHKETYHFTLATH